MKEDYLWNKTGSDAEIERLENALKAFRYQEIAPPELPAKIIPFAKKNRRGFFRLSFGLAAFAAILIVCLVFWFQSSNVNIEPVNYLAETVTSPQKSTAVVPTAVSDASRFRVKNSGAVENASAGRAHDSSRDDRGTLAPAPRKVVGSRKFVSAITPQNDENAKNIEAAKPTVKLTKEEIYAYDQLMLALSITSSKLKLVSDKVEGIEEQNAVLENGR